jgi:ABC-type transporter lipoprotein component MlaA
MVCFVDSKLYGRLVLSVGFGLFIAAQTAVAGDIPPSPPSEVKATGDSQSTNDPFESINRVTSGFNAIVRGAIIDPLVDGYQAVTPEPV